MFEKGWQSPVAGRIVILRKLEHEGINSWWKTKHTQPIPNPSRAAETWSFLLWSFQWKKSPSSNVANFTKRSDLVTDKCRKRCTAFEVGLSPFLCMSLKMSNYSWQVPIEPLKHIFAQGIPCRVKKKSVVTVTGIIPGHSPCTYLVVFQPLYRPITHRPHYLIRPPSVVWPMLCCCLWGTFSWDC